MESRYCLYLSVPSELDETSAPPADLVHAAAQRFLELSPSSSSQAAGTERLERQLAELNTVLDSYFATVQADTAHPRLSTKQQNLDSHFHVVRASGNAQDLLVASAIYAFSKFFVDQQQGTTLLPVEQGHLIAAVQLIVELFGTKQGDIDDSDSTQ